MQVSWTERLRALQYNVRIPRKHDKVYKDECMFSFDTPESPGGLYTSLSTWQSFGADYVERDHARTNNSLYLKHVAQRVALDDDTDQNQVKEPTKLGIGVEGGFDLDKKQYELASTYYLVLFPERAELRLPADNLPNNVGFSINAIMKHDGVAKTTELAAAWEEEDRKESKYAKDLEQLDTGKKISPDPSQWKCEESGMTENLWLNLSTGHIGSGRKNWDGSGGTGAALKHFETTGQKYPLVVKLGTITPAGADVYSYAPDENSMVLDPFLGKHLAHWGINMLQQEKTEMSIAEMELELNKSYKFDKITESGSDLVPLHGPGYIGLENLGSSCYMSSVLQILFSMPEIVTPYRNNADRIFASAPTDPSMDLLSMMAKLAMGLSTSRYSKQTPLYEKDAAGTGELQLASHNISEDYGTVRPLMFKRLIGKGHPEFSTKRQQDACEFFQYFLEKIAAAESKDPSRLGVPSENGRIISPTQALFGFQLEERLEDSQSRKVSYVTRTDNILSLTIDTNWATNRAQFNEFEEQKKKRLKLEGGHADEPEPVQLSIPASACIQRFGQPDVIEDFLSPETGMKGTAMKRTRFQTFPPYLAIHLRRYYVAEDWTPKKLDVSVLMPEELNLGELRATGPQPEEELMPESKPTDEATPDTEAAASTPAPIVPDPGIVSQLMAMGFSENGSKRAALATNNASAQASMEWVFAHMEDSDFNDPLPVASSTQGGNPASAEAAAIANIANLTAMGFSEYHAKVALKASEGSLDRAADWLFRNHGSLDAAAGEVEAQEQDGTISAGDSRAPEQKEFLDGEPKYELLGFASHLGSNTSCGHYVAHVKKEGRFVLFNDSKVAVSKNPPIDLGLLYFYRRKS